MKFAMQPEKKAIFRMQISKRTKSENENVSRNVKKNTNSPGAEAYGCGDSYTGIGHVVRQHDNARIFGGPVLKKASITQGQIEICFALRRLRYQTNLCTIVLNVTENLLNLA